MYPWKEEESCYYRALVKAQSLRVEYVRRRNS